MLNNSNKYKIYTKSLNNKRKVLKEKKNENAQIKVNK